MELPENMSGAGFWFKFGILFVGLVVIPIFFLDFTDSLNWFTKILFMVGGGAGILLALNGKALGRKKQ